MGELDLFDDLPPEPASDVETVTGVESAAETGGGGSVLGRELVLASAGSGKTHRLSSRLIGLLAAGVPAEEILASTFTRKAAGEILDRVLNRLASAALDPAEAQALTGFLPADVPRESLDVAGYGELLVRTVRELHRLHIHTLDAFFHRAGRSFALELGLPRAWTVANEADEDRLRAEAVEIALSRADPAELAELVRLVGRGDADRDVHWWLLKGVKQLHRVYRELDPLAAGAWGFEGETAPYTEEDDREVDDLLSELRTAPLPLTGKGLPHGTFVKARETALVTLDRREWIGFLSGGIAPKLIAGATEFSSAPIPPELARAYRALIEKARKWLRYRFDGRVKALGRFLPVYDRAIEGLARSEGLYSFDDLTHLLGRAGSLGLGDELFYRLDGRVRHVLVDEFQDTSNAQWAALEPIVGEILSGYEGERAAFLVGDPKQSIYGWRGGEPRILEGIRKDFSLPVQTIAKSFRSSTTVLDAVNAVFGEIAANPVLEPVREFAEQWAASFAPHHTDNRFPGYVRLEAGRAEAAGHRGWQSPLLLDYAAEKVKELSERAPDATIGVLTRGNAAVGHLIARLRLLGLEASEEGGVPVVNSAPVLALLGLLKMADHPGDRASRYLVAQTPVGELVGFTGGGWASDTEAARVSREVRARLAAEGYGPVIAEWVRQLAPIFPDRDRRRLRQTAELAFKWDARSDLRPSAFVRMVAATKVEDPAASAVRVMTVWRAKGLEFDAVVLPELDNLMVAGNDFDPYVWFREDGRGSVRRVYPRMKTTAQPLFPEAQPALDQARARDVRDALSALYVGITRARYAVYVYVRPDPENGKSSSRNGAAVLKTALAHGRPAGEGTVLHQSGLESWWDDPVVRERLEGARGKRRGEAGAEARGTEAPSTAEVPRATGAPSSRLELAPAPRRRLLGWATPSRLEGGGRVSLDRLLAAGRRSSLLGGTAVHAWLEAIEWIDSGIPDDQELLALAREHAPGLAGVQDLLRRFRGWLEASEIRELLSGGAFPGGTTVDLEVPFVVREGNRLLSGSADRVLRIPDADGGRLVVVDWKTDELDIEDAPALEARVAFYAPQVQAYVRAISLTEGVPIDRVTGVLAFLVPGRTRAVPAGNAGDGAPPPTLRTT